MSYASDTLPESNASYVNNFGSKGSLPLPPGKKLAVVSCMDARLDSFAALGLKEGDAHHIRNAGGRIDPGALRSLVISQSLLGTREIIVVHHTGCGMLTFTTSQAQDLVKQRLKEEDKTKVDFPFLEFADIAQSLKDDVKFLKESPLIFEETKISGWNYHVETGKLEKIV